MCTLENSVHTNIFCFYNRCFFILIPSSRDLFVISVRAKERTLNVSDGTPAPAAAAPAGVICVRLWVRCNRGMKSVF